MKMQTNRKPTAKRKPVKNSKKPEVAKVGRPLGDEAEQQQKKDRLANITYLRDKGNEPLPDDPMLDGWKRERTIMRALLRGEVLPTKNHCMSGVADYEKLLSEWIEEAETHRRVEATKRADSARLAHLLEVRDHLFIALEFIHKYHPNPCAKQRIESETARIKSEYMAWKNTISKGAWRDMYCRGEYYAALADRTAEICREYTTLLNEFYREDPALIKNRIETVTMDFEGEAKEKLDAILSAIKSTQTTVTAHFAPRTADYQVTQEQLARMLTARNCPKTVKTIQRWEKYLQTNGVGKDVTKPPTGYTLQTRLTDKTAAAWVEAYTASDTAKLNTKISFEARFGGRT